MMASGNTNKFYDAAWEHNMRNNLQLQKQYTEVELKGLNLAIMRGEKIPVIIPNEVALTEFEQRINTIDTDSKIRQQ